MAVVFDNSSNALQSVDINPLALNITAYYAADLSYTAVDVCLSSILFGASPQHLRPQYRKVSAHMQAGILTLLVIVALIFLL